MDSSHRRLLQQNRTFIIENLGNPITVNDLLYQKNIFTESMRQEVEAEPTKHGQTRKILDYVPRRGPNAFETFYTVMLESENEHIADVLRPDMRGNHPFVGGGERGFAPEQSDIMLPENWPNFEAMSADIHVKPCNVRAELVRKSWNNPNVYSMKRRIRGTCLIISNQLFFGPSVKDEKGIQRVALAPRHGTEKDVKDLTNLFSQLHFNVVTHRDLTKEEIQRLLFRTSSDASLEQAECFVFVICSHGTSEGVYGVDGNTLSLDDITTYFDSAHCQYLQNKPKLFFIQACQGEEEDRFSSATQGQDLTNLLNRTQNLTLKSESDSKRDYPGGMDQQDATPVNQAKCIPTKQDILVACATHPGYVSIRNTQFGSWFIQAVVYVFQKYACEESIQDLLTMVNRLVAKGRTSLNNTGDANVMQAARFTSSLTKKFLFFPGVIADSELGS